MNPWLIIMIIGAVIIFGLDYLFRRKKWKDNSNKEKISLILNMFSVGPNTFLSALSMLWGIVGNSTETHFGNVLYNATLTMASFYFVIAIIATISSLILRKKEKINASIWVNIIAFAYIAIVLTTNTLVGKFL